MKITHRFPKCADYDPTLSILWLRKLPLTRITCLLRHRWYIRLRIAPNTAVLMNELKSVLRRLHSSRIISLDAR